MGSHVSLDQPVVVLGGFLITAEAYAPLAEWIASRTGATVRVVPVSRLDWLATSWGFGWARLLDRVDAAVRELQARSASSRVTLIGHSSGGVMLRPYLSDESFCGRRYGGATRCNRLITLGSPHQAVRATPLRALVDRRFPGCPHADSVDYVAVAGRLDLQGAMASGFSRRSAARSYRQISGDPSVDGDGLVPVSSALLREARPVVLENTAHGGLFGRSWYGSVERIPAWWTVLET
ncbi:alpha/beta hydrolase family protein [Synechococcus sp. A15-127]|uniref:esterase/lipase family protein n=1 Tax=Synechococcus sp. A15-127 TaxID=1050624 RepID=UPI00164443E1|nr:esterase [Synechococcus sp. A15-127]QNI94388.1 alpha/beta hydrolase family protein [Synechococcus sp. A15-127]